MQWMRGQRGPCEATLDHYRVPLRRLITRVGGDPRRLDAQGLRQFVLESVQKSGRAVAKKCTTAVRMFLRFLIAEGQCPLVWMRRFQWLRIGVFRHYPAIYPRMTWSV